MKRLSDRMFWLFALSLLGASFALHVFLKLTGAF